MGKTLTDLRASIGSWLDVDTNRLDNTVRDDIINIVIRELLFHDLRFGEFSDTFATVASTRTYALPQGWKSPNSVWYQHPTNNGVVYLEYVGKDKFDGIYPDPSQEALPERWTFWGSSIYLGKTPDQVVTINRNYNKFLRDLELYTAATISFDDTDNSINDSAGAIPLRDPGETLKVTGAGAAANNGTFTVVSSTASKVIVSEAVTTEAASATITLDPSNPVTAEAWECVLFKALVKASEYGIEDERLPVWMRQAEKLETDLIITHSRARSTGRRSVSREP